MRDANHTSEASRPLATFVAVDPESLPMGTAPHYTFRYIDIASATQGRLLLPDDELEYRDAPSRARRVLRDQDVIMSTVRPNLKAFAYCRLPPGNFVASTGFAVLRAKEGTDPRFILYSILSDDVTRQIERFVVGSNYPAINSSDVKRLRIPNLSPAEQARIGEIIGTVDEAIEQTEALIAKTQQIKAGLMHDLFTRGVTADGQLRPPRDDAPQLYKESPLGWIPETWEVVAVGECGEVFNGTTPSHEIQEYWGGAIPWLSSGKVNEYRVGGASEYVTERALSETSLRFAPPGSVLVAMIGQGRTRGMSARLEISATINQNLAAIVPNERCLGTFLHLALHKDYGRLRTTGRGSNRDALNCQLIREFLIAIPPLDEQQLIDHAMVALETKADEEELYVEKLRAVRGALTRDLLTGRVPVSLESVPQPKEVAANV